MAFKMEPSQLKIAEKLVILNDRAVGLLTRIYNIKKVCGDPKSKPHFLNDKQMESAIKHIMKKFPVVDTRSNMSTFSYANSIKEEITKSLGLYYNTFADLLDLKDHVMQLLTTMDAYQCQLDITLNYELTSGYLNLIVNLISLMILLSRVEDRKAVLGLFNAAHDLQHGQSEAHFPRLGQMILDYEHPLKKLHEDLGPLNRLIFSGLTSLSSVYMRKNITAEQLRKMQVLSLISNPQQILYAAQTDTVVCEYLSLDVMDRWIIFCGTVCHTTLLNDLTIHKMWQLALQMGLCLRVFRDEVFYTHQEIQAFHESVKGNSKKVADIKECYAIAVQQSASIHAERRRFLRSTLRELVLLIKDQPGIIGPKTLFVWMALCFARDEIVWLLRHLNQWPSNNKKGKQNDELTDKQLPELLHYTLELRELVMRHSGVIHRYYLQYVSNYDAVVAHEIIGKLQGIQEEEAVLLQDFVASISNINSDTDLRALRLDWFRFQAWTSVARSTFTLKQNPQLAVAMNTTVFHLKMIDLQDEVLRETSDLSIYCFYPKLAEIQWKMCIQLPAQARYSISFARICGHYTSSLHEMCPEERNYIVEKSLATCNSVLTEICRKSCEIIEHLCEHELRLTEQVSPNSVATRVIAQMLKQQNSNSKVATAMINAANQLVSAGDESQRVDRMMLTLVDKLVTTLLEVNASIGMYKEIYVSDHVFAPKTYLYTMLENDFIEMIHGVIWEDKEQQIPRRPTELLAALQAYMTVLQTVESSVSIDMTSLIKTALLGQTQGLDARGKDTITAIYSKWYLEELLRRASSGQMVWSEHLKMMINSNLEHIPFAPEQYSDPQEIRALAQIIGPYGIKYISERLTWHIASQINELNKIVVANKDPLATARSNFDNQEKMREVINYLSRPMEAKDKKATCVADAILQRTIIIGQICAFREALHSSLKQIVSKKLPFMDSSFNILFESLDEQGRVMIGELTMAMGYGSPVDVSLANAIRAQNPKMNPDEHYLISCLLFVAIAICLPRIGLDERSTFKPTVQASVNNSHCVPLAINFMASGLFHLHGQRDTTARMKEFIALASSGILRTAHEKEGKEDVMRSQTTLYVILEQTVRINGQLTLDILEACFPYNLVRTAYQSTYEADARQ